MRIGSLRIGTADDFLQDIGDTAAIWVMLRDGAASAADTVMVSVAATASIGADSTTGSVVALRDSVAERPRDSITPRLPFAAERLASVPARVTLAAPLRAARLPASGLLRAAPADSAAGVASAEVHAVAASVEARRTVADSVAADTPVVAAVMPVAEATVAGTARLGES